MEPICTVSGGFAFKVGVILADISVLAAIVAIGVAIVVFAAWRRK